jgi:hypothetical protein
MADLSWLEQLVSNDARPVMFVFAGKAHPADEPAQGMMREMLVHELRQLGVDRVGTAHVRVGELPQQAGGPG